MVKHLTKGSGGTSKFRLVVIDAELQDGEISQLAQAIQGAFGAQRVTTLKLGASARVLPHTEDDDTTVELNGADTADDPASIVITPAAPRPRAPKKLRTPNLDSDLNPGSQPSFKVYAEARNVAAATSVAAKFLTVAAWLHEERGGMKITADRAYTCFRFIGWPFNIDFDQPLRDMKSKSKFLELKQEDKGKGEFSITHLGLNKATEMKNA